MADSEMLDPAEFSSVAEIIVRNQLKIKELTEQNDTLKAFFKENSEEFPVGSSTVVGKFYIKVTKNSRVDDKLARELLSVRDYNVNSKMVIDSAHAKARLAPDVYTSIQKVYENKIEVGLI